jgi:DNA-binding transcriptional ArsR family regulator
MPVHTEPRSLTVTEPEQLKALSHPVRARILELLARDVMSAKGLSALLEMTHGKVGHHLNVLFRAGLIEIAEERPVRAVVERFYRTTYDRLRVSVGPGDENDPLKFMLRQAAMEALPHSQQPFEPLGRIYSTRMNAKRAEEFAARLVALADEFASSDETSGQIFGFVGAVYEMDIPNA